MDLDTGTRLFRIDGRNFNGSANAIVRFSESRWYSFPVEGTKRNYPTMSAVDKAGRHVIHLGGTKALDAAEIVIPSDQSISEELLVMMATVSQFLAFFFLRPGD